MGPFEGLSLQHFSFQIPPVFFDGITQPNYIRDSLEVTIRALSPSSPEASTTINAVLDAKKRNVDHWIDTHIDRYNAIVATLPNAPTTAPTAPTPVVSPASHAPVSRADMSDSLRANKTIAIYKLLTASVITDTNGTTLVQLGELRESAVDIINEPRPRAILVELQETFSNHASIRQSDSSSVINSDTDFATAVITTAWLTRFHNGYLCQLPLGADSCDITTQLNIFNFLRIIPSSQQFKRIAEESNEVRDQYMMVGETLNSKQVSSHLIVSGDQRTHADIIKCIANTHCFITFLKHPDATTGESHVANRIHDLFKLVKSKAFENWIHYVRAQNAYWIAHSILSDFHAVFAHAAKVARDPDNISKVLQGKAIDSGAFTVFDAQFAAIHNKWSVASSQLSCGLYNALPSTCPPYLKPKSDKGDKGGNKWPKESTGTEQSNSTSANATSDHFSGRTRGSDPTKGFIVIAPGTVITGGPRGLRPSPCLNFIAVNRSCPNGRACDYAHINSVSAIAPDDIPKYCGWINATQGISWKDGPPSPPNGSQNHNRSQQSAPPQPQNQNQSTSRGNRNARG